jgi:rRNA maturation endonuclease Nob1
MKIRQAKFNKQCHTCPKTIWSGDRYYKGRKGKHLCLECGREVSELNRITSKKETKPDKVKGFFKWLLWSDKKQENPE